MPIPLVSNQGPVLILHSSSMPAFRKQSLLLAALLLLAQLLLAVHHADLDAHAGNQHCDVCLIAHGLDHSTTVADFTLPRLYAEQHAFPVVAITGTSTPAFAYHSRAPPVFPG